MCSENDLVYFTIQLSGDNRAMTHKNVRKNLSIAIHFFQASYVKTAYHNSFTQKPTELRAYPINALLAVNCE